MHLSLQPLFILANALAQDLLGIGWLASKVLAGAQLLAYCLGLFLVSRFIPWKDWERATLILAVFFVTITAPYYRFDDYHITTHDFEIYSVYLLLLLWKKPGFRRGFVVASLLGLLSGLSVSNRLNDGAALFLACLLALPRFLLGRRVLAIFLFGLSSLLSFAAVIALTGDSVHTWWIESVIRAATIKGGTGSILLTPATLPGNIFRDLRDYHLSSRFLFYPVVLLFAAFLPDILRRPDKTVRRVGVAFVAVFAALATVGVVLMTLHRFANLVLSEISVLLLFALGLAVHLRLGHDVLLGPHGRWTWARKLAAVLFTFAAGFSLWLAFHNTATRLAAEACLLVLVLALMGIPRQLSFLVTLLRGGDTRAAKLQLLLLIPFWQLLAAAMTAGRSLPEFEPAIALSLLVLPISSPWPFGPRSRRAFVALAAMLALSGAMFKTLLPYTWHHFHAREFFSQREWYRHPELGPMYIEKDQLQFMLSMCDAIHRGGPNADLLALPYPYPNYFCGITPWHGFVQTWYDTSGKSSIDALQQELQTAPPMWIAYQRGLDSIRAHEVVFNMDRPLPHRALDRQIMDQIAQRRWTIVRRDCFGGADWILIRTTAPASGEHQGEPQDAQDRGHLCAKQASF